MKKLMLIVLFILPFMSKAQYEVMGLSQDKQKHFATCLAISGVVNITAYDYYRDKGYSHKQSNRKARIVGFIGGVGIGIFKEVADYRNHKMLGTWNNVARQDMIGDLAASALGSITVTVAFKIFEK